MEGTCLDGLYFDKAIGKCNDQKKVECNADLSKQCTSNSIYLADPESCQHYYLCINGKPKRVSCPKGSNFNPESSSCVQTDDYKCQLQADYNICDVISKLVLFKHDEDCHKYRLCSDNGIVERTCPGSLWFDPLKGVCNLEGKNQCGGLEPNTDPVIPENSGICGSPSRPYVGLVHDGRTCRGYYHCEAKFDDNGQSILNISPKFKQCGKNEIFAEKSKECVPRQQSKCRFDRCDGWDNSYVNIEGDGCRGYAMCESHKEVIRMKCPDNYYFDELKQDCVTSIVNYKSCSKAQSDFLQLSY